jgi:hypothetical protein
MRRKQIHDCLDTTPAGLAEFCGTRGHQETPVTEAPQQCIVIHHGSQHSRNTARHGLGPSPSPHRKLPAHVDQVDPDQRNLLVRVATPEKSGKGILEGLMIQESRLRVKALAECQDLPIEFIAGKVIRETLKAHIWVRLAREI